MTEARLDRTPAPLDWRFGLALTLGFFVTLVPRVVLHEMWRDEWHTWLLCRDTPDLATLFARLRYDGHPATWYVIVWLLTRLSDDPLAMKLAHAAIASATAAVVAVAAPFPRWQRVLLVLGYFFAFEYAVISRNYALGAFGLFLAAACHARGPARPIATCAALAIVLHSNAFAALAGTAIAAYVALGWLADRRVSRARLAVGLAIVAASAILVAIEVRPPGDMANTPWSFDVNIVRAGQLAASFWRSFVPLPAVSRGWWSANVLDFSIFKLAQAAIGPAVLLAATLAVSRDLRMRAVWLAIVGLIVTFAYLRIVGSVRHHGTYVVAFIALRWIDVATTPPLATAADWRERFWRVLLGVQFAAGAIASVADLLMPFSAAPATARYLHEHHRDALVITQRDYEGGSIAGELGQPVYFPVPGRWATYVLYNDRRSGRATPERLDAAAGEVQAADPSRPVVLVVSDGSVDRPNEDRFRFVARFADASVDTERYNVYVWQPDATTAPAAGGGVRP